MLSTLESQLRVVLDDLSNEQTIKFTEEDLSKAIRQFEEALLKQTTRKDDEFRLRMSNIGRPSCVLQQEKAGAEGGRNDYNHWLRMMIGDCVEILVRMVLEKSTANVSSDGDDVSLDVSGTHIKGSSDIDIEGKVYDIKSASDWAYKHKWQDGFEGVYKGDDFGYVGQLYGYADAQNKEAGGWIVVNKSSGEITVVEANPTADQEQFIRSNREYVVDLIVNNRPFRRCFEPEEETFNKKLTGGKVLSNSCRLCKFKKTCWPKVKYLPSPVSRATPPPNKWYIEYPNEDAIQ